jgi:hypothetical protein
MQPLDLLAFGVTKRAIACVNPMETVNVQSDHIAQVVAGFMSAASPSNVVGTFARAGLVLALDSDGRLCCRVFPEKDKCLFNPIEAMAGLVPTNKEIEELEHEPCLEHMAEIIVDEMQKITE